MIQNLQTISRSIRQHMGVLRSDYKVNQLGVFGSVARGDDAGTSDVDMLVDLVEPVGLFKFIDLEDYLSNLLGRKVDLVTKDALKLAIKDEVLKETVYV